MSKEFLVRIAGFYGPVKGNDSFKALWSITFYTNKAQYGAFGDEIGPKKKEKKKRLLKGTNMDPLAMRLVKKTKIKNKFSHPHLQPKGQVAKDC